MTDPTGAIIFAVAALLSGTIAQGPTTQEAGPQPATRAVPVQPGRPAQPLPPLAETSLIRGNTRVAAGQNVRIEVTLSDQGGSGAAPATKTVTITTNDGHWGKLRAAVTSRLYGSAPLNVDARPFVLGDGRLTVELTIEYNQGRNPDVDGNPDRIMAVSINQSTVVVLDNGKPQLISQSADPIGDRKVTVEVKATVLRQ